MTFEDRGAYLAARLDIADANGSSLMPPWNVFLYATVKTTDVALPASQTFVFRTEDGGIVDALATVSVAYDAKKATAAFSGKLYDGTAVKATVPVIRVYDEGSSWDYSFAPFLVIAKDGTVYCFNEFYCWDGGYVEWVAEHGEDTEDEWSDYAEYASAADLAAKAEEGIAQLRRYAADPTVSALSAGTRLHLILYQFQGMELIRLEEIAESGR